MGARWAQPRKDALVKACWKGPVQQASGRVYCNIFVEKRLVLTIFDKHFHCSTWLERCHSACDGWPPLPCRGGTLGARYPGAAASSSPCVGAPREAPRAWLLGAAAA